ncbi:MAG: o-succinylbenzoate synthase [Verrucomicrobiota bacterium]
MSFRFSYRPYRRAFRRPLRTTRGEWSQRDGLIVCVERADGQRGFGEVAPIPDFGTETLMEAREFLDQLVQAPELELLKSELGAYPCCAFALSAARLPVVDRAEAYALSALLPAGSGSLEALQAKISAGYLNYKWKIAVLPVAEEIAILDQLVALLPAGAKLRLDANGGLCAEACARWMHALAQVSEQIDYLEQPLPVGEEARMEAMSAEFGVPVALDESLNGASGSRWFERGAWSGHFVVKPLVGGDYGKLLGRLRPHAARVTLSSVFETGIGLAHALRLAADLPGLRAPLGFDTLSAFDDALSMAEIASDGLVTLPNNFLPESIWKQLPLSS